jgi:hypothetical protein
MNIKVYNFDKITLVNVFVLLFFLRGIAQTSSETPDGVEFLKRIEYNIHSSGIYNVAGKTETEKLFFGDFNAMIEFCILPSFEGAYGFRVFKDSSNNYIIENKRIANWDTVRTQLSKEFPSISINGYQESSMTKEEKDKIAAHNMEMFDKQHKECYHRYEIVNQSVPVSNLFVEKLYKTIMTTIDNFTGKGKPRGIMDGYRAIFRCVVEDEVWTFNIRCPSGKIEQLTNICQQIIKDMETNHVNESEYVELLNNIHRNE